MYDGLSESEQKKSLGNGFEKAFLKSYRNSTSLKEENLNLEITNLIGYYHGNAPTQRQRTVLLPGIQVHS